MNNEQKNRVRQFVEALRSGKFRQTQKTLARYYPKHRQVRYCCLGVAQELAMRNGCPISRTRAHNDTNYGYVTTTMSHPLPNYDTLNGVVFRWYGFRTGNPSIAITPEVMNKYVPDFDPEDFHVNARGNIIIEATVANDEYNMSFADIADGFERMYLEEPNES